MDTKQVIVIRKDLNMRKGKMVAAGAHAAMWALLDFVHKEQNGDMTIYTIQVHKNSFLSLDQWLLGHYKKICVSVNSEQELIDLCEQAKAQELPYRLQHDIGLTEFDGVRTVTCCAIGPGPADIIDAITGKLPLL